MLRPATSHPRTAGWVVTQEVLRGPLHPRGRAVGRRRGPSPRIHPLLNVYKVAPKFGRTPRRGDAGRDWAGPTLVGQEPNFSPLLTMARRAGPLRSFLLCFLISLTHAHILHRFHRLSIAVNSPHQTPGVFRRSALKNTPLASRTNATPPSGAGTFAQPQAHVSETFCQMVSCLVPVWLFECARRL